ncbi:ABC transporter ATP-binding protein [Roseomonas sp. CCTCC AB2023176]|uniref:ABC transporter ATP-binding protein n=1 Tax=Roseomonas sp. CCTCC AB2023176 TaxID=3342640 RepID=UPI0035DBC590
MATISLRDLTKRWGDFVALKPQSLEVADGEFIVLLGPSGCGKTTTMRMIAGLEEPSGGDILIGGRRVNDDPPKDRDVAMVFQNYGLYPHMTVAENIGYPLKVRGLGRTEREKRVKAAADTVELGPLLARRPRELSGGQRQRVALARAIVRTPQAFLMDEPLSNLDARLRVTMRAEIKHLQQTLGVTTIYVTHDQIEAMTLAHRVAVMSAGEIRQLGTPEDIYDHPADLFVAGFIGSPPMNLIPGTVEGGAFRLPGAAIALDAAPGTVVLGVRPEDTAVTAPGAGDLDGEIYATEMTGESVLVTATIPGGTRVIARTARGFRHPPGTPVGLRLDRARLHLFDKESGKRLAAERVTA